MDKIMNNSYSSAGEFSEDTIQPHDLKINSQNNCYQENQQGNDSSDEGGSSSSQEIQEKKLKKQNQQDDCQYSCQEALDYYQDQKFENCQKNLCSIENQQQQSQEIDFKKQDNNNTQLLQIKKNAGISNFEDLGFNEKFQIKLLEIQNKEKQKLKNKSVIAFFGVTGAGKSTTICSMFGVAKKIKKTDDSGQLYEELGFDQEVAKIASSRTKSETLFLQSIDTPQSFKDIEKFKNMYLLDMPGTMENRGFEVEISNQQMIASALQQCDKVKPILVFSVQEFKVAKMESLKYTLKLLCSMIDIKENIGNISVFITQEEKFKQQIDAQKYYQSYFGDLLKSFEENYQKNQLQEDQNVIIFLQSLIKNFQIIAPFFVYIENEQNPDEIKAYLQRECNNIIENPENHIKSSNINYQNQQKFKTYSVVSQQKVKDLIKDNSINNFNLIEDIQKDLKLLSDFLPDVKYLKEAYYNNNLFIKDSINKKLQDGEDILSKLQHVDECNNIRDSDELSLNTIMEYLEQFDKSILKIENLDDTVKQLKQKVSDIASIIVHNIKDLLQQKNNKYKFKQACFQLQKLISFGKWQNQFIINYDKGFEQIQIYLKQFLEKCKGCVSQIFQNEQQSPDQIVQLKNNMNVLQQKYEKMNEFQNSIRQSLQPGENDSIYNVKQTEKLTNDLQQKTQFEQQIQIDYESISYQEQLDLIIQQQLDQNQKNIENQLCQLQETFKLLYQQGEQSKINQEEQENNQEENKEQYKFDSQEINREIKDEELDRNSDVQSDKTQQLNNKRYKFSDRCFNLIQYFSTNNFFQQKFQQQQLYEKNQQAIVNLIIDLIKYIEKQINVEDDYIYTVLQGLQSELFILKQFLNLINLKLLDKEDLKQQYEILKQKIYSNVSKIGKSLKKIILKFTSEEENPISSKLDLNKFFNKFTCLKRLDWIDELLGNTKKEVENTINKAKESFEKFIVQIYDNYMQVQDDYMQDIKSQEDVQKQKKLYQNIQNLLDLKKNLNKCKNLQSSIFNNQEETEQLQKSIDSILLQIEQQVSKKIEELKEKIQNKSIDLHHIELNVQILWQYKQVTYNFKGTQDSIGFKQTITNFYDWLKEYYNQKFIQQLQSQLENFILDSYPQNYEEKLQQSQIMLQSQLEQSQIQSSQDYQRLFKKWKYIWQILQKIQKKCPYIKSYILDGKDLGTEAQELIQNQFLDILYENYNDDSKYQNEGEKKYNYRKYLFGIQLKFQKVFEDKYLQEMDFQKLQDPETLMNQDMTEIEKEISEFHKFDQNNYILEDSELVKKMKKIKKNDPGLFEKCLKAAEDKFKFLINQNFSQQYSFQYWEKNSTKIFEKLFNISPFIELFQIFDKLENIEKQLKIIQDKFEKEFQNIDKQINENVKDLDLHQGYSIALEFIKIITQFNEENFNSIFKKNIEKYTEDDIYKNYLLSIENLIKRIQSKENNKENSLKEHDFQKIFSDIGKLFELPNLNNKVKNKLYEIQNVSLKKYLLNLRDNFESIKKCNGRVQTIENQLKQLLEKIKQLEKLNITTEDLHFLAEQQDIIREEFDNFKNNQNNILYQLSKNFLVLQEQEIKGYIEQLDKTQKQIFQDELQRKLNLILEFIQNFDIKNQEIDSLEENIVEYKKLTQQMQIFITKKNWILQQNENYQNSCKVLTQRLKKLQEINNNKIFKIKDFSLTNDFENQIKYMSQVYRVLENFQIITMDEYNEYIQQKNKIEQKVAKYLQNIMKEFEQYQKQDKSYIYLKENLEKNQKSMDLYTQYKNIKILQFYKIDKQLENQLENYKEFEQCKQKILDNYKDNLQKIEQQLNRDQIENIQNYIKDMQNIYVLQPIFTNNTIQDQQLISNQTLIELIYKYQSQLQQNCYEFLQNKNICDQFQFQLQKIEQVEDLLKNNNNLFKKFENFSQKINIQLTSLVQDKQKELLIQVTKIQKDDQIFQNIQEGSIDLILKNIINFYGISDIIINKEIQLYVINQVEELLVVLKDKMENDYFLQLGQRIGELDSQLGLQIVNKIGIFMEIRIKKFQKQTISMSPEYVVDRLKCYDSDKIKENLSRDILSDFSQEQKEKLLQIYQSYQQVYNDTLDNYYSLDNGQRISIDDIKSQILGKMKQIKDLQEQQLRKYNSNNNENNDAVNEAGFIIGKIFVLWSIIDRKQKSKNDNNQQKQQLRQPHPVQVFSIIIMLNLQIKLNKKKPWYQQVLKQGLFQNQIFEILTGQGKSITLGITALIFALLGYDIKVACYSKYLSERDYQDFENLYQFLEIKDDQIFYGTYFDIIEQFLNKDGYIRDICESYFIDKQKYNEYVQNYQIKQNVNKKTILLIDEIDQFFSNQIYGQSQNPSMSLKSEYLPEIFNYIWQNKDNDLTSDQIFKLPQYSKLIEQYKIIQQVIEKHVDRMIICAKQIEQHYNSQNPQVVDGVIGYKVFDSINLRRSFDYYTVFAYYKEHDQDPQKISKQTVQDKSQLKLILGHFSYAQFLIEMQFENILGVTGTLIDLNYKVFEYFKEYNLKTLNFAPSIYPEKNDIFKEKKDTKVLNEKEQWFATILSTTVQAQKEGQPTIIFFKNINDLKDYKLFLTQSDKYDSSCYQILLQEYQDQFTQIINKSTKKGQVTLADSIFGRGVDYQCYDNSINKIGGLLIIITFISKIKVEEKQIMGRTGRNGQAGEVKLLLLQKNLEDIFEISQENIQNWKNEDKLYENINKQRNLKGSEKLIKQKKQVDDLKPMYTNSKTFLECLLTNNENKMLRLLKSFNI